MKLVFWIYLMLIPGLLLAGLPLFHNSGQFGEKILGGLSVSSQSTRSLSVDFQIEDLTETPIILNNQEYIFYNFKEAVIEGRSGKPAVPYVQTRLAVPEGAVIDYEVSVLQTETRDRADVVPQNRLYIRGHTAEISPDQSVYGSPVPYPEKLVRIGEQYNFRGVNVITFRLNPVQYFPKEHRVRIYKQLRILFRFEGGDISRRAKVFGKYDQEILSHKILNVDQAKYFLGTVPRSFRKKTVDYDLSSGHWFKIPIKNEGIYQITGSMLSSKGVNIGEIPVDNVHLYNYGGYLLPYNVNESRPADLNEIAVKVVDNDGDGFLDEEDRVIFYGKGVGGWKYNWSRDRWEFDGALHDRGNDSGYNSINYYYDVTSYPYDDTNYYLLNFNMNPGKRIQPIPSPNQAGATVPSTFTDYFHFEEDKYNILSSGADWQWIKFSGMQQTKTVDFLLPQNLANAATEIDLQFKGGSGSLYADTELYKYTLKALINGQVIFNNFSFYRAARKIKESSFDNLFSLQGGNNELEINYTGNRTGAEVFLEFLEIRVKRPFTAENNILHFRKLITNNVPYEYQIDGLPAGNNVVWDITDLANITEIQPLQNGQSVVFQDVSPEPKPAEYVIYSPGVIQDIPALDVVENYPNLRDPSRRAEFLIITPDEFYEDAEFLENWRESQIPNPIETERIKLSHIFLEFSSGVRDITAIRDFIKYVYENWSDTLRYVLLFGDGHYDYRNLILQDIPNYVPPFEITNSASSQSEVDSRESDNFYVALGMQNNLASIDPWLSIGRLTVNSPEEIDIYREKAANYRNSYLIDPERNGWQNWVTLVSDDERGGSGSTNELGWHLTPTETVNKSYIPRKFNRSKIYLHDYESIPGGLGRWKKKATEDLLDRVNRGTLLVNFFGHGDPDSWAHEWVLNRPRDLHKINNVDRLPLWVAATCTWGKFDDANRVSMSEEMIRQPQRGGIAVISASRPVYVSENVRFAKDFYGYLFRNQSENLRSRMLGEAVNLAMRNSVNYQKFHLLGDPTLRLADARYTVQIESVEPDTLKALSTVSVQATITDQNGNPVQNFQGNAVLHVFDAVDSLKAPNLNLWYTYNGGTLFKGLVTVENGHLTGNFIVPKSIKYKPAPTGRLSIYAWDEENGDAAGFSDNLLFYGTETQLDDQSGPEIEVSFKGMPGFFDGDYVSNQPTLMVRLSDQSGINLTGEVGHRIELTIDEQFKKDVTEFFVYDTDSYQKGKLEYTLPALGTGTHQLKISGWDNLNNYSEREASFRTSTASELSIKEVVNYPNPFSDQTYFTFQLVPSGSFAGAEVTVNIYTVTGRKIQEIKSIAETGFNKIKWDGRDWDGDLIANGVYLYKIVVDDGEKRVEKIDKLAVVR